MLKTNNWNYLTMYKQMGSIYSFKSKLTYEIFAWKHINTGFCINQRTMFDVR